MRCERDASIDLILSIQIAHCGFESDNACRAGSLTLHSVFMRCGWSLTRCATTRPSTRFVKRSRCFLHSGVIEMTCMSIRDGTLSIAPSLTWRAQWRNVRRRSLRRRLRRRRRPRSGSRHAPFSSHVTEPAASTRTITIERDIAGFNVTTEGVGETSQVSPTPSVVLGGVASRLRVLECLTGLRLEARIARAPEFRPGLALLELAGLLGLAPFRTALLLTLSDCGAGR